MKKIRSVIVVSLAFLLVILSVFPAFAETENEKLFEARNGVVEILTYIGDEEEPSIKGSGFIIENDLIITDRTLVSDNAEGEVKDIKVVYTNGFSQSAKVLMIQEQKGFAILKTDSAISAPEFVLGIPEFFKPSAEVYALGVSKNASNINELSPDDIVVEAGRFERLGNYENNGAVKVLEHSALIDEAITGGPLIYSEAGKVYVVGVNSYSFSDNKGTVESRSISIDEITEVLKASGWNPDEEETKTTEPTTVLIKKKEEPASKKIIVSALIAAAIIVLLLIIILQFIRRKNTENKE